MPTQSDVTGTAFGPMFIVAVEQFTPAACRIVDDPLAAHLLPRASQLALALCKWTFFRDRIALLSERRYPGLWGSLLCRKRYGDDRYTEAVRGGATQVVLLGAGLDDRPYRAPASQGRRVVTFELDLPVNIDYKRRHLQAIFGHVPQHARLVPIDFETGDIVHALENNGYRRDQPSLFVWEAVTQYLTEGAVRRTLACLTRAATGSQLIFTYVQRSFLQGTNMWGCPALYAQFVGGKRRLWHFGLHPDEVRPVLAEYGWEYREQVGEADYRQRYLEPLGRRLRVTDLERFVAADRR